MPDGFRAGLNCSCLGLVDAVHDNTVCSAPLFQRGKLPMFAFVACDYELAAFVQRQFPNLAIFLPSAIAVAREPSFKAVGRVIDTAMEYAAIAAACMLTRARFFIYDHDVGTGGATLQFTANCKANDASSNDEIICFKNHALRAISGIG
jgi:hypothetical protein